MSPDVTSNKQRKRLRKRKVIVYDGLQLAPNTGGGGGFGGFGTDGTPASSPQGIGSRSGYMLSPGAGGGETGSPPPWSPSAIDVADRATVLPQDAVFALAPDHDAQVGVHQSWVFSRVQRVLSGLLRVCVSVLLQYP